MRLTFLYILLCTILQPDNVSAAPHRECIDIYSSYTSLRGYNGQYADLLCEGRVLQNRGEHDRAAARYRTAMKLPHPAQPGIEVWPLLAASLCKINQREEAKLLLADYSCALEVYQAKRPCYPEGGTDAAFVRSRCFHAMCKEGMIEDYGPFTNAPPTWFIALQQQVIIAQSVCKFQTTTAP